MIKKLLTATLLSMLVVAGCGSSKKETTTIVKPKYTFNDSFQNVSIKFENGSYNLDAQSTYVKKEIARINSELNKVESKLGGKDKVKIGTLSSSIAPFLAKSGVELVVMPDSPFYPKEMSDKLKLSRSGDYYCDNSYTYDKAVYLTTDALVKLDRSTDKEGCYLFDKTKKKFVVSKSKAKKIDYEKLEYGEEYHNLGNRFNFNMKAIDASGVNLMIVDKLYHSYFSESIKTLENSGVNVVTVDIAKLEDTFILLSTVSNRYSTDSESLSSHWGTYKEALDTIQLNKSNIEKFKGKKVLILLSQGKEYFILQPNSYFSSWLKQMGIEVFYPDKKYDDKIERKPITLEEVQKLKPDYVINLLHSIEKKENYIKRDEAKFLASNIFVVNTINLTSTHYLAAEEVIKLINKLTS